MQSENGPIETVHVWYLRALWLSCHDKLSENIVADIKLLNLSGNLKITPLEPGVNALWLGLFYHFYHLLARSHSLSLKIHQSSVRVSGRGEVGHFPVKPMWMQITFVELRPGQGITPLVATSATKANENWFKLSVCKAIKPDGQKAKQLTPQEPARV